MYCLQCLYNASSNRDFYLSQCMKTFCGNCLENDPQCHQCSSECGVTLINDDMPENLKILFQDPLLEMKKIFRHFQFLSEQYNSLTGAYLNLEKQYSEEVNEMYFENLSLNVQIHQKDAEIKKLKTMLETIRNVFNDPNFHQAFELDDQWFKLDDLFSRH